MAPRKSNRDATRGDVIDRQLGRALSVRSQAAGLAVAARADGAHGRCADELAADAMRSSSETSRDGAAWTRLMEGEYRRARRSAHGDSHRDRG
jgi:hypothetical protein